MTEPRSWNRSSNRCRRCGHHVHLDGKCLVCWNDRNRPDATVDHCRRLLVVLGAE